MKKSNNAVSQHKQKRAKKNQKRIAAKPYLSRFERKQLFIREQLLAHFKSLQGANTND